MYFKGTAICLCNNMFKAHALIHPLLIVSHCSELEPITAASEKIL